MIDRKLAENIKTVALTCANQLDRSVKDAIEGAPEQHASMYRRLVGQVMGQLFTEILMPIYAAHPDLEPAELRNARHNVDHSFIPSETSTKLMGANVTVTDALTSLREDLAQIPEGDVRKLLSGLQQSLDLLRDIREFLRRTSANERTDSGS